MKTIADVEQVAELSNDYGEILELIDEETDSCLERGDLLGVGEWTIGKLPFSESGTLDATLAKVISLWASPTALVSPPASIAELIFIVEDFPPQDLAVAVVGAIARLPADSQLPGELPDLAFRLSDPIRELYELGDRRAGDLTAPAVALLQNRFRELQVATDAFCRTEPSVAKVASVAVIRAARKLRRVVVAAERPILSEIEMLLGPAFRKFCESCERQESNRIIDRVPQLRKYVSQVVAPKPATPASVLHLESVAPIARHVIWLLDEGVRSTQRITSPRLSLTATVVKAELGRRDWPVTFRVRLLNEGNGSALQTEVIPDTTRMAAKLELIEPGPRFDMAGKSEQLLSFRLTQSVEHSELTIPIRITYSTLTGEQKSVDVKLEIQQQETETNWDNLLADPPYPINAVRAPDRLFGRSAILRRLLLHAAGGTSTFLWGQKRVGKTSIAQVLRSELEERGSFVCAFLRIGELGPLHEGQIGHRIASHLVSQVSEAEAVPSEDSLGAGLGAVIPFIEELIRSNGSKRFVVIIDEFDELNSSFYTGERGQLFVAALRSLSEVGITFFFIGSERMRAIYERHQRLLNKWVDVSLDCIESLEDIRTLILAPVHGAIEYPSRHSLTGTSEVINYDDQGIIINVARHPLLNRATDSDLPWRHPLP